MKLLFAVLISLLAAVEAHAQSCDSARAQLAAAQSGGGGGAKAADLRQKAAAYGCNTNSMFGRAPQCASIEAQLRRASGGADSRTLRRLQRQVSSACAPPKAQTRTREARSYSAPQNGVILHGTQDGNALDERARSGNIFSRIFGDRRSEEVVVETVRADPSQATRAERVDLDVARRRADTGGGDGVQTLATGSGRKGNLREGNQRTVCVRLCDGFYFPINSRSHSDNYYEELAMCVGRCPGADVSLYTHSSGAAVESMRSAMTGEAYARLPTAFLYRKALVPDCGCQPQTTITAEATADKALSYVGLASEGTPEQAAASAAGDGRWTPLQAVYDETGKPLDLSLGTVRDLAPTSVVAASATAGSAAPKATPAVTPIAVPAVADAPAEAELAPAPTVQAAHLREVGGQFYSRPVTEHVPAHRKASGLYGPSAVSLVPVGPNVITAPIRGGN